MFSPGVPSCGGPLVACTDPWIVLHALAPLGEEDAGPDFPRLKPLSSVYPNATLFGKGLLVSAGMFPDDSG